jgi:hypothetical protein
MNISAIKKCLDKYDLHKGVGRNLKDEPHIRELRAFYQSLQPTVDRELNPEEHWTLVSICLGKQSWNGSQSSETFRRLLKNLGGKEALQQLQEGGRLTKVTARLIADSNSPETLANLIVLLKGEFEGEPLIELLREIDIAKIGPKLKNIEALVKEQLVSKEAVLLIARSEAPTTTASTIFLLSKYKVGPDFGRDLLASSASISDIYHILELLEAATPNLIEANFKAICQLGSRSNDVYEVLKELTLVQEVINQNVLESLLNIEKSEVFDWLRGFLGTFREARWTLPETLPKLIALPPETQSDLIVVVNSLALCGLYSEVEEAILSALFNNLEYCTTLCNALKNLASKSLQQDLFLLLGNGDLQYVEKQAEAIEFLHKTRLDKQVHILIQIPAYSRDFAYLLTQLVKAGEYSDTCRDLALKVPQKSACAAKIVKYLREHKILRKEQSIKSGDVSTLICEELFKANLMNVIFEDFLVDLKEANLLTLINIRQIIGKAKFFYSIVSASTCLANGRVFNQENFNLILDEPSRAIAIAKELKGKPRAENSSELEIDKGVEDLREIKKAAYLLAKAYKNQRHQFFPDRPANSGLITRLCQLRQHDYSPLFASKYQEKQEKKILSKIAAMCGNGYLEESTEEEIANEIFNLK